MRRAGAVLLGAVLTAGCGPAGVAPDVGGDRARTAPGGAERALGRAQAALALDVYAAAVRESPSEGLALGPASLHTALLLARAGAAGRTAQELDDVLHLAGLPDALALAGGQQRALLGRDRDGVELSSAGRAWVDDRLSLREDYRRAVSGTGADLAGLDVAGSPETARRAVNAWAEGATRGKIEELMPPGSIDDDTRLVLTTATYLKARWARPFEAGATAPAPFVLLDGQEQPVDTMRLTATLPVARGQGWSAVRLPYVGDQLSMTVVAPDDLASFEDGLDLERLDQVDAALAPEPVALTLPRFSVRRHLSLPGVLAALGMPSAFAQGLADFSGMAGSRNLVLGAVEHEAVVEVDEEGTEAAAATGVAVQTTSLGPEPSELRVDRPFLFVVRDDATGAVLFLGRVTDPR